MKEPYGEDLASRSDPESCGAAREDGVEALTGAGAGRVSSREITKTGVPTLSDHAEGNTAARASASAPRTPRGLRPRARAETLRAGCGRAHDLPWDDGP